MRDTDSVCYLNFQVLWSCLCQLILHITRTHSWKISQKVSFFPKRNMELNFHFAQIMIKMLISRMKITIQKWDFLRGFSYTVKVPSAQSDIMQNGLTNLSGELAKKKCDLWSDICSIVFIAKAIKISISAKPNILALNLLEWGVIRTWSNAASSISKAQQYA